MRSAIALVLALLPLAPGGCSDQELAETTSLECTEGDPGRERHGTDCLCCHGGDFSVAGSIAAGAPIVAVEVDDAAGTHLVMPVDAYGNFFQHEPVAGPLRARTVDALGRVRTMVGRAPHGSCNRCHAAGLQPGPLDAPAR